MSDPTAGILVYNSAAGVDADAADQTFYVDPTGATVDDATIFLSLDDENLWPNVAAYISSLLSVDIIVLPGANALLGNFAFGEGSSTARLRIIFQNPGPGYRHLTAAEKLVYSWCEGAYTITISHTNFELVNFHGDTPSPSVLLFADSDVGAKTASFTITNYINLSGDLTLTATGRAGNPASLTAVLTNVVQTDGPFDVRVDSTAGNATADVTATHCDFITDTDNEFVLTRPGSNTCTLVREFKNCFFFSDWADSVDAGATLTNRDCLNNFQEAFFDNGWATAWGDASNVFVDLPGSTSSCIRGYGSPGEDLRLLETSPLRRAGAALAPTLPVAVRTDGDGLRRHVTVPDVGAFNFEQTPQTTGILTA